MTDTAAAACQRLADWNPLAPEELAWPYRAFAEARRDAPVFYNKVLDAWVVTRYDDIVAVMRDTSRFSSRDALYVGPMPDEVAHLLPKGYPWDHPSLVNCDPPDHTRIRKLANQAFKPSVIAAREPEIRAIADGLIDSFVADGNVDLVERLAMPLPAVVVCRLLSVPDEDAPQIQGWAEHMSTMLNPSLSYEARVEASRHAADFYAYCEEFIDARRRDPRDDLMTALIDARADDVEGEPALTQEELISIFSHLHLGGNETTPRLIGSVVLRLLEHGDQMAAVLADPALVEDAVEETLRHTGPVKGLFRRAVEAVELGGVTIPEGALVAVMWGSANHDEGHFAAPEQFHVGRPDVHTHMAFGRGVHFCIGAPVARLETRVAIEQVLARLPNLRRADDEPLRWLVSPCNQGLERLLVAWDTPTE